MWGRQHSSKSGASITAIPWGCWGMAHTLLWCEPGNNCSHGPGVEVVKMELAMQNKSEKVWNTCAIPYRWMRDNIGLFLCLVIQMLLPGEKRCHAGFWSFVWGERRSRWNNWLPNTIHLKQYYTSISVSWITLLKTWKKKKCETFKMVVGKLLVWCVVN